MPLKKRILNLCTAILALLALPAAAEEIAEAKSQITASFRQMNVPIEGSFKRFSGMIHFDPKRPATAQAKIEVDTTSFDVGAPEYNDELLLPEWFNAGVYPRARFVAKQVKALGSDRFEASGQLSLKGQAHEMKVPFTRHVQNGVPIYEGEFPISRKEYSIGSARWDGTLDDKVVVKFHLITTTK